jgi:hypothetical protein
MSQKDSFKNPNEDSIVTDNHEGTKVDAGEDNPDNPGNQVTDESQKGKKVDADLSLEQDRPGSEERGDSQKSKKVDADPSVGSDRPNN